MPKCSLFTHPPRRLRKAKLDNLALVPASLLPFKEQWQELANNLSPEEVLIVLPETDTPQRNVLEAVADLMRERRYRVTSLSTAQVVGPQPRRRSDDL